MTASTPTKQLTQRQQACLWFALAMLANGLAFVSLFRGVNTAIAGGVTCLMWVATYACLQRAWACWDAPSAPSTPAKETA
ncbi:hypothetical protein [Cupriavidus sp. TMH.W2]|uniref:hypothetical protein n=1 Tax=Cupriavidus sp. TMH.W2 TaxID=3434465 RepID=UPI003D776510